MDVGGAGACFPFPTPTPARFFGLCPLLLRHCVNLSLDKDQGAAAYLEEVSLSPHAPFTEPGATSPLICSWEIGGSDQPSPGLQGSRTCRCPNANLQRLKHRDPCSLPFAERALSIYLPCVPGVQTLSSLLLQTQERRPPAPPPSDLGVQAPRSFPLRLRTPGPQPLLPHT